MDTEKLLAAENALYNSPIKDLDKNLKKFIKAQKEFALSQLIDDELEC